MIAFIDFLGLIMSLATFSAVLVKRKRGFRVVDFSLLISLVFLNVIINLGNTLEWSGITGVFDAFEDYLNVLVVAFWGFFLVSLTQFQYERAYKESEEKYHYLVESANSIILRMSPTGHINFLNRFGLEFFGFTKNEVAGRHVVGTIVPETESSGRDLLKMIEDICVDAERFRLNENENITKDGNRVWVSWTNRPIFDEKGRLMEILCIGNDITRLMRAEHFLKDSLEEKEILLKEIHHRVKNNLQIVSGLLNLQSMHIQDETARGVFKESENRIISMSLIHEYLHQSTELAKVNCGDYIRNLIDNLFRAYQVQEKKIGLVIDIDNSELNLDTAIPCGLIINELVTNALIHAFPEKNSGKITVQFKMLKDGKCKLTIKDNGIGMPKASIQNRCSLGLKLVELLAKQMKAELGFSGKDGTSFCLIFSEYTEAGPILV